MAMASSTLVTFRFVHEHAFSVDLVGSWDNFSTPIPLKRDKRRSHDEWTVCPTFKHASSPEGNQEPQSANQGSHGGLQQSETYWYYYVIDGDEECCDPMEATTSTCAVLPGQRVNILNVPHDLDPRAQDALEVNGLGFSPWTLDPNARFRNPKPASADAQSTQLERLSTAKSSVSSRKTYRAWSSVSWARPFTTWISQSLHRKVKSASAADDRPPIEPTSRPATRRSLMGALDATVPQLIDNEFSAMQLSPDGMSLVRRIPITYSVESIATITEETTSADYEEPFLQQSVQPEHPMLSSKDTIPRCEGLGLIEALPILSPGEVSSAEDYFDVGSPSFASTVPSTCGVLTPRRLSDAAHYFEPLTPFLSAAKSKTEQPEITGHQKDGPTPMERFLDEFDYLGSMVF